MTFEIALTGHRPNKLGGYDLQTPAYTALKTELRRLIELALTHYDIINCHSGMALGADTIWAMAIYDAKAAHPSRVQFTAEIPCATQASQWPLSAQAQYQQLLSYADVKHVYAPTYQPSCMHLRNRGMIKACQCVIAVYNGNPHGGTANTVHYAQKLQKQIIYLKPQDYFNNYA